MQVITTGNSLFRLKIWSRQMI